MKEVQVIDLFSGCGGMSYGFAAAETSNVRFKLLGGLDVDPHANATYQRMLGRPALQISAIDLLDRKTLSSALRAWGYQRRLPLVLIGCAPCQGFSSHRKKDNRADDRNSLISTFAKIVSILKPDVAVMENVPELLHRKHWRHFATFRRILEGDGYLVRARLHNAAEFGVPQERFRALVVASKKASLACMPFRTHLWPRYVTVRHAIGALPELQAGAAHAHDAMHITSKHRPETVELLRTIPADGGSRSALPVHMVRDCHREVDGFRDVYGRLSWDKPSVAITARCRTPSCGRFAHPEQHRGLSVREAALLQGFPANWHFEGPFDDKFKQIGNAVPPPFAKAVARAIDSAWPSRTPKIVNDHSEDVRAPIRVSISSSLAAWKRKLRQEAALQGAAS